MQRWSKILEYLRKHQNTNEIILIFQPENLNSDPISNTLQEYFPELHDVHSILLTCAEQKSVLRAAQRSILRSLSLVGWFKGQTVTWLFRPLGTRVHAYWEHTTNCIILTRIVNRYLKWTNSSVHKLPVSLAGWWTWKSKQHARWTPLQVLCDTELKSCPACQEC